MLLVVAVVLLSVPSLAAERSSFNRDIRPILSDNCFQCHGPDKTQRKADLRLDRADGAIGTAEKPGAIVPGKPDDSKIVKALRGENGVRKMPAMQAPLADEDIKLIADWIAAGAKQ